MRNKGKTVKAQIQSAFELTDEDVLEAMKEVEGYLDITVRDFRELYIRAMKLARKRFFRSTPVKSIMQSHVAVIQRNAGLEEIIRTLAENSVSGLPVMTDTGRLAGVVSEKDIFNRLSGEKDSSFWQILSGCVQSNGCLMKSITSITAGDIMSSPAVTVGETASVRDVLEIFSEKNINRLPVVDTQGSLVGIITRSDILKAHLAYEDQ